MLPFVLVGCAAAAAANQPRAWKALVDEEAIYRIGFEDLAAAVQGTEPPLESLPSVDLAMTAGGEPVAIWVEDGGDGRLGPGDHVEFWGRPPRGEHSSRSEHSRYNVYRLAAGEPAPGQRMSAAAEGPPGAGTPRLRLEQHLEPENVRVRFAPHAPPGGGAETPELWYWKRLSQIDPPFTIDLDLAHHDPSLGPLTLRADLRGWSDAASKTAPGEPDHRVELLVNDRLVAHADWNGQQRATIEADVPARVLRASGNQLALRVPKRRHGDAALIDVVLLNWVEASHPQRASATPGVPVIATAGAPGERLELDATARSLTVYGASGWRAAASAQRAGGRFAVSLPERGEQTLIAVADHDLRAPARLVADAPSRWRDPERQADYLVISHPSLLAAIEPLAAFHRRRGLTVAVIDVDDLYDEWGHGVVHPLAIRGFIAYASEQWRKPAPRFVLLVGDASFDVFRGQGDDQSYADWTYREGESARFVKNKSDAYESAPALGTRNLVPTFLVDTYDGPAASDNTFVTIAGDDFLPDLAIGRFPVTEPAEVAAIVHKTLRYAAAPPPGDWRQRVLLLTNEEDHFQRQSDRMAEDLPVPFAAHKIYPRREETDNRAHQDAIRSALDQGQTLVHFVGHGGRYIWRTGPPDVRKNHDLFTLDDLERLRPNDRLPLVLSMTCYSAPFDHPTADSIGEKFLRLPDRGAVAVLAASWRNSPSQAWSRALIEELLAHRSIGEAILRAKQRAKNRMFAETYNLLGDPAIALPPPEHDPLDTITERGLDPTDSPAAPAPAPVETTSAAPRSATSNVLKWSTASEVENFGYDVYRGENEEGPFERITDQPIAGAGTTDQSSSYRYEDRTSDPGKAYYYYVESISLAGERERFTPIFRAAPKRPAGE